MINNASRTQKLFLPVSPDSAFAFSVCLFYAENNPFIQGSVHVAPQEVGVTKTNNQMKKKSCGFPWQSLLWLGALVLFFIFFQSIDYTSLPTPQGLAPIVFLPLPIEFVKSLAGTPWMTSWRGNLVRPSVWRSMEMCGRGWWSVAIW